MKRIRIRKMRILIRFIETENINSIMNYTVKCDIIPLSITLPRYWDD